MNKSLEKINLNQNQVVSGVALFSTAALSVYTIKNTLETNKKIDEIYEDLNKIKNFVTENQRKNNINTAALGKKIEEIHNKFVTYSPQTVVVDHSASAPEEVYRRPMTLREEDEVDNAVSSFLQN